MCKIFKTKSYLPFDCKGTINDIDYTKLYENGRKIILFDLDNTLIPYDLATPNEEMTKFFQNIQEIGFQIIIISNNNERRVATFANVLGLSYVGFAKKPLSGGYKKALRLVSYATKKEVIAVGDQLMTDVLGANRVGIDCILVHPIKKRSEKWFTKINRWMERQVMKRLKKKHFDVYCQIKELEELA